MKFVMFGKCVFVALVILVAACGETGIDSIDADGGDKSNGNDRADGGDTSNGNDHADSGDTNDDKSCKGIECLEGQICEDGICVPNETACPENDECINDPHCWGFEYNEQLKHDGLFREYTFKPCKQTVHKMVVPKGMTIKIETTSLPSDTRLFIYDSHFFGGKYKHLIKTNASDNSGKITLEFTVEQSGEHVLVVDRTSVLGKEPYELKLSCVTNCDLKTTRFPVVFIHGYAGADKYFDLVDYFWNVKKTTEQKGYLVFMPVLSPIETTEIRAGQLSKQIDEIFLSTGAQKLNLIAHSQGGLDSRVLISGLGYEDRIASLTTIATPHRGIGIFFEDFISKNNFSPEYAKNVFNPAYPDSDLVKYWSYSFRSCGPLDFVCQNNSNKETVDVLLTASFVELSIKYGDNDGIVPTYSMPWGEHLGLLFADHFDEVGHLFDGGNGAFDHLAFYHSELERLENHGL